MSIRIPAPRLYLTGAVPRPSVDKAFGYDEFARAATETYSQSYDTLPTCYAREFATFFSRKNYENLYKSIVDRAGNNPDEEELFETMMRAFSMVAPRSDEMDMRRTQFDDATIISYVQEMNDYVLEIAVSDVIAGNEQEEHFRNHRWGPGPEFAEDQDMHYGIDTRTRLNGSSFDMTYMMC
jgi:hypothetical protein